MKACPLLSSGLCLAGPSAWKALFLTAQHGSCRPRAGHRFLCVPSPSARCPQAGIFLAADRWSVSSRTVSVTPACNPGATGGRRPSPLRPSVCRGRRRRRRNRLHRALPLEGGPAPLGSDPAGAGGAGRRWVSEAPPGGRAPPPLPGIVQAPGSGFRGRAHSARTRAQPGDRPVQRGKLRLRGGAARSGSRSESE